MNNMDIEVTTEEAGGFVKMMRINNPVTNETIMYYPGKKMLTRTQTEDRLMAIIYKTEGL